MQRTIEQLRLLLATIRCKEEELGSRAHRFRRQLDHTTASAIRGGPLDSSLSMMSEIQERMDDGQRTRSHLDAIKTKAQDEVQALELTGGVEQAKDRLRTLRDSNSGPKGPLRRLGWKSRSLGGSWKRQASAPIRPLRANCSNRVVWPGARAGLERPASRPETARARASPHHPPASRTGPR